MRGQSLAAHRTLTNYVCMAGREIVYNTCNLTRCSSSAVWHGCLLISMYPEKCCKVENNNIFVLPPHIVHIWCHRLRWWEKPRFSIIWYGIMSVNGCVHGRSLPFSPQFSAYGSTYIFLKNLMRLPQCVRVYTLERARHLSGWVVYGNWPHNLTGLALYWRQMIDR